MKVMTRVKMKTTLCSPKWTGLLRSSYSQSTNSMRPMRAETPPTRGARAGAGTTQTASLWRYLGRGEADEDENEASGTRSPDARFVIDRPLCLHSSSRPLATISSPQTRPRAENLLIARNPVELLARPMSNRRLAQPCRPHLSSIDPLLDCPPNPQLAALKP
ncbi:hypothetical protein BC827DRAFT_263414 [Russula dissimulans]|nr:hypothetical protein BC827DRAFT_263414 [Russula dissimulans]